MQHITRSGSKQVLWFFWITVLLLTASPASGNDQLPPFESLFQNHGSVMLIIDTETGNIVRANQAALDFYGFSEDALTSMNIHDINTLSYPEVEEEMRAAARDQRNFFRFRHRAAGGEIRDVEVRSYPYSTADQDLLYSIITDITPEIRAANAFRLAVSALVLLAGAFLIYLVIKFFSRSRKAEASLKQSEEMFRQMAENINEVFWLRSADNSEVLYISPAYEKVWGRTCLSLYDNPGSFIESVHPEDRERVIREYTRELNNRHNGRFNAEYRVMRPDNTIRWVWARSFPVKDETGRVIRYTGLAVDITRIKEAEQKIREQEQFLESMFNSIQDGISVLDNELNIIHVNPVMEKWFENKMPLAGKKCYQVYHHRNTPCPACPSLLALDSGRVESCTVKLNVHDHTRWHEVFSYPMLDMDTGHALGFVEFVRDVTSRKKNEQELIQARKKAEAASRAKSMFLANMSHEIRTPISGITGALTMLLDTGPSPDRDNLLNMALNTASSLKHIIDDILDLSQVEAGKLELHPRSFDPAETGRKIISLFSLQARDKGILLDFHAGSDLPSRVMGDPARLEQILRNLVSNAVKFTDQGQVILRITPLQIQNNTASLLFEVEDTGQGIPADLLPRIFDEFYQADSSYSKKYQGTGLGLAISRKLVEMMGGTIQVRSRIKEGTVFSFQLDMETASEKEPEHARLNAAACSEPGLPALRILVAEDVRINREFIEYLLSGQGHTIKMVTNGQEAVTAFSRDPFDLVIMDIQMPEMNGLEATRAIRDLEKSHARNSREPGTARTPVIALTAYAMKEQQDEFLAAGMDGYAAKPVEKEAFFREISKVMNTSQPGIIN